MSMASHNRMVSELFFKIPFAEHMFGLDVLDWKTLAWKVEEKSIQLFNDARDGQGFSLIVSLDRNFDKDAKVIATIHLLPAFNGQDGLPRENKRGEKYKEVADAKVARDYVAAGGGSGVVHQEHRKFLLNKKVIRDVSVRMGGGVIKGAESVDENDYIIAKPSVSDAKVISSIYKNKKAVVFNDFSQGKKYLLLCEDSEGNYEIYYIQNQKLVFFPYKKGNQPVPSIDGKLAKTLEKKQLVNICLEKLNLHHLLTILNKSASQNNTSIEYDLSFECYSMYLDPKKHQLLEPDGKYIPEGREAGSLFELRRSIPPELMEQISSSLRDELKVSHQKDEQTRFSEWSPWTHPSYDQAIHEFKNASTEEKSKRYFENLKITLELYKETLLLVACAQKIFLEGTPQEEKELANKYPHLQIFNSEGAVFYTFFNPYLSILQYRLKSLFSLCVQMNPKYSEQMQEMVGNTCHQVEDEYKKLPKSELTTLGPWYQYHLDNIQMGELKKHLFTEHDEKRFVKELTSDEKENVIQHFRADGRDDRLRSYLKRICDGDEEKITTHLVRLINTPDEKSNKTPLLNAIQHGWFDMVAMFVSYGAQLDVTCLAVIEKSKEEHAELFKAYKDQIFPEKIKTSKAISKFFRATAEDKKSIALELAEPPKKKHTSDH